VVEGARRRDVTGWAMDAGLTWLLPVAAEPRITAAYAVGSGDRKPDSGTDESFRQTGLHGNEPGFGGVERFRAYGELLDPELSNLSILTFGLGVSLGNSSSLDVAYHQYRLVERADSLRDARLDVDLTGRHRDLGKGLDLTLAVEEWERIEFRISASLFRSGRAFGEAHGEWVYGNLYELRFAF
jgi:hypothetical protein